MRARLFEIPNYRQYPKVLFYRLLPVHSFGVQRSKVISALMPSLYGVMGVSPIILQLSKPCSQYSTVKDSDVLKVNDIYPHNLNFLE